MFLKKFSFSRLFITTNEDTATLSSFYHRCLRGSWFEKSSLTSQSSQIEIYIMTLYWAAATMTSTGYGDIRAHTSNGEVIVLFVLITGLMLYGYCLSSIAATLANKLSPK